eukprot:Gb_41217 [translate_table: standard]
MPPSILCSRLSRCLTARDNGSTDDSLKSAIRIRVGSARAPAPVAERTFNPRLTHAARSDTLVSMLSIQSRTKSGWPPRISSSDDASYNCTLASTWPSGKMDAKCFLRQSAFEVPTSSLVATACLFNDDKDT